MSSTQKILPDHSCSIVSGPLKYDFQASLFDKKIIKLSIIESAVVDHTIPAKVFYARFYLIKSEGGSTETWTGECKIMKKISSNHSEERVFYYNTKTRKGTIMERTKTWDMK